MNIGITLLQSALFSAATPILKEIANKSGLYVANKFIGTFTENSQSLTSVFPFQSKTYSFSDIVSQLYNYINSDQASINSIPNLDFNMKSKSDFGIEILNQGVNSILFLMTSIGIGKAIVDTLKPPKMEEAKKENSTLNRLLTSISSSDPRSILYLLLGLYTYIIYSTGENDIKDFLNKEKTKLKTANSKEIEDVDLALGLSDAIESHKNKYEKEWSMYHMIVEKFYKHNPYYDKTSVKVNSPTALVSSLSLNPLRIIFNILIGLSIQLNSILNSNVSSGADSVKWLNLLFYIELLCRILKFETLTPLKLIFGNIINGFTVSGYYGSGVYKEIKNNKGIYPDNPWKRKK